MGPENSNAGISDPLCSVSSIDEGAKIQPHLSPRVGKVEVAESGSAGDAGQGCDRAGTLLPRLLQPPFLGTQEWGTVEADHRSVSPQRLHRLPELHYGDSSVNSQGLKTRPMAYVPGFERRLLSNRDSPSRQTVPPFLSQRHLAVQSTALWSLNQSKSFYQNTQAGTSLRPFTRGKATHVPGRLVVKPGFSSGSSRANILAQVPVPKIRAGHKSGEVGINPFPESHLSGNRAGLPCWSRKTVGQESDQMDLHSGGIHSSAVTTRCSMAPSTGTLSFPRETSTLWSGSHPSTTVAIKTALEPEVRSPVLSGSTRLSVPPVHPMVDKYGTSEKRSSVRDFRCGVLPVYRQQYSRMGCSHAEFNCSRHMDRQTVSSSHQCSRTQSCLAGSTSLLSQTGQCNYCSHVRQHICCCLPEKSGGDKIPSNERSSSGHMPLGRRSGYDISTQTHPRTFECVSGPSVKERPNPKDRMEPEPDHSGQGLPSLGQATCGSICPREECKVGNIHVSDPGANVLESGQSSPVLEESLRLRVSADKPNKGMSEQNQDRGRRGHSDSPLLAKSGVVPRTSRSHHRLPTHSSSKSKAPKADLLTPLSSKPQKSQPSRLEVIQRFHQKRGFSEAIAKRLAISQRASSAGVYEYKWKVFGEWCRSKQLDPCKTSVPQLSEFLTFLFEVKHLSVSSIAGYRSGISKVFASRGINISHNEDLNMLVKSFYIERPVQRRESPRWDLMVVLRHLLKPPFEPMNKASISDITRKTAFLLTLATAKRNSEVWAFSADVRFGHNFNAATLKFLPSFLAKTVDPSRPETFYAPVTIPALGPSMGTDLPDRYLCPVRALRIYMDRKHKGNDPSCRFKRLLSAHKVGHTGDISKKTVSGWVRSVIKQAYLAVEEEDLPHLTYTNFQVRELRAFASSLAFHQSYSLKQVMEAASWRNDNTFVSFYLRDISQMGDITSAGPFVAGQKVISN